MLNIFLSNILYKNEWLNRMLDSLKNNYLDQDYYPQKEWFISVGLSLI